MDLMTRWLQNYEKRRHSRRNSKQHLKEPNESWISSKYDLQGTDWQTLQQMYLPELKMCFGPACNSLKKLWKSYKIAGRTGEPRSDIAWKINRIQDALGILPGRSIRSKRQWESKYCNSLNWSRWVSMKMNTKVKALSKSD